MRRLVSAVLLFILLGYTINGSVAPGNSLTQILWETHAHYTLIYAAAVFATATGLVMERD